MTWKVCYNIAMYYTAGTHILLWTVWNLDGAVPCTDVHSLVTIYVTTRNYEWRSIIERKSLTVLFLFHASSNEAAQDRWILSWRFALHGTEKCVRNRWDKCPRMCIVIILNGAVKSFKKNNRRCRCSYCEYQHRGIFGTSWIIITLIGSNGTRINETKVWSFTSSPELQAYVFP